MNVRTRFARALPWQTILIGLSLLGRFLPRLGPLVTNKRLFFFVRLYLRIGMI